MEMSNETYTMSEMYRLGMDYLVDRFGVINTEMFLAAVKTNNSDYTKWRRRVFDYLSSEEFDAAIAEYVASRNSRE